MEAPKIVITHRVHKPVIAHLRPHGRIIANTDEEPWPAERLLEETAGAAALMAFMPDRIDAAFLDACPKLCIIACALKGYDNFDVEACTRHGVWLTVVDDLLTQPTAELTIGMMIAVSRNMLMGDRLTRSKGFAGWRPRLYGTGLAGSRIGILGMGAIGRAIAKRLCTFGADVFYWDKVSLSPADEVFLEVRRIDFDAMLSVADFVIVALPLNSETAHLLDRQAIDKLKPGAFLINPARGGVVDEAAVGEALEEGRLGGYAADTFELEDWARAERPRHIDPRILAHRDRTVLSPHLGSAVGAMRQMIEMQAADSIIDALSGRCPRGAINAPRRAPTAVASSC